MHKIVDVSNNNGHVDFHAVKAAGAVGVWLKVTEGTGFVDSYYSANYAAAKKAGLKVGGYHFGHPSNNGSTEAAFFLSHLKIELGDLLPVLDIETTDSQSGAVVGGYAKQFVLAVKNKIGEWPVKYGGTYFFDANGISALPGPVWYASYGAAPSKQGWAAWQFTDGQPQYPGSICHLDTSVVTSVAVVTYKASPVKKAGGHLKRVVLNYALRKGFSVKPGSPTWKWWQKNKSKIEHTLFKKK